MPVTSNVTVTRAVCFTRSVMVYFDFNIRLQYHYQAILVCRVFYDTDPIAVCKMEKTHCST